MSYFEFNGGLRVPIQELTATSGTSYAFPDCARADNVTFTKSINEIVANGVSASQIWEIQKYINEGASPLYIAFSNSVLKHGAFPATPKKSSDTGIPKSVYTYVGGAETGINIDLYDSFDSLKLSTTVLSYGTLFGVHLSNPLEEGLDYGLGITDSGYESAQLILFKTADYGVEVYGVPGVDPYAPGGNSEGGGGTGTFDGTGDEIETPSLPTLTAVSSGMVSLFVPTLGQLNSLSSFLWSNTFFDAVLKLFASPMDAIIGLSIVPVSVPTSGAVTMSVAGISTGISINKASTQFVTVNCGSLQIKEYWGSALDYEPNTRISIYLPYIGVRTLNTDEVMGKTISLVYNIDVLTGSLTAILSCGGTVLYQFSGNCACSIPLSGRDFNQLLTASITAVSAIGLGVATGGASAPVSGALATSGLIATATNVATSKPRIEHSGCMGSTAGQLGVQTPYLIIERPKQCLPQNANKYAGYPSYIYKAINTLTGYTEIADIHLEDIPATSDELEELERILKGGFII